MPYIWLIVIIAAVCVEAATSQLVSIWFALGGIAALIASLFSGEVWLQCVLFVGITAVTLLITRPLARKKLSFPKSRTNADRYVGETAVVLETIDNVAGKGEVKVMGSVWTARSANGEKISQGASVRICSIEGVRAIVEEITQK